MAVELCNWMGKDFQTNIAVFDIISGTPMSSIADPIVERSRIEGKGK